MIQQERWQQRYRAKGAIFSQVRKSVQLLTLAVVFLFVCGTQLASAQSVAPEEDFGPSLAPNSQLPRWIVDELIAARLETADVAAADVLVAPSGATSLIIDSDFGVDDTVAVAALLSLEEGVVESSDPIEIQGLVTVAGITTVEDATNNALLLLSKYGVSTDKIPVIIGAKKPQKQTLSSTGKLIHGPDGLWWASEAQQQKHLSKNAKRFYCREAQLSGATLLTLGPLTNVADAIKHCKETFAQAEGLRLVVLGGVDMTGTGAVPNEAPIIGNNTPVTEFNMWQDPEAAQYVFEFAKPEGPGDPPVLDITLIPQNTFDQYVISEGLIGEMAGSDNEVATWLTVPFVPDAIDNTIPQGPLSYYYYRLAVQNGLPTTLPDVVAAAYAVDNAVALSTIPSIVDVFGDSKASGLVGGESLIAQNTDFGSGFWVFGTNEQITQVYGDEGLSELADAVFANGRPFGADFSLIPAFLLDPDGPLNAPLNNAQVVTQIDPALVHAFLAETLTPPFSPLEASAAGTSIEELSDGTTLDERIFLPFAIIE